MSIEETKEAKELRLKINKLSDMEERENAFYTLYRVTKSKDVLTQFEVRVSELKIETKPKKAKELEEQYTKLLELVLNYSHAIFYLYSKSQINKNLIAYRRVALNHIDSNNTDKAFKLVARLRDYKEQSEPSEEPIVVVDSKCLALDHIEELKKDLENDNINAKTGVKEDKKAYMKIAIIALGTGARVGEIMSDFEANPKKTIFDAKYLNKLLKEIQEYQKERKLSERTIRNGIDNLELGLSKALAQKEEESFNESHSKWVQSVKIWEDKEERFNGTHKEWRLAVKAWEKDKAGKKKPEKKPSEPTLSSHCRNINHLKSLYLECIQTN